MLTRRRAIFAVSALALSGGIARAQSWPSREALGGYLKAETGKWAPIIKAAGITIKE